MLTDPIDPIRAADIIDAYGADAARWPGGERAGVLAAIARDPALRARLAEAARLDADLAAWAMAPVESLPFDLTSLEPQAKPGWRRHIGWAGAGLAAVAAALALLLVSPSGQAPQNAAGTSVVAAEPKATTTGQLDGFAYVFTPTHEEENLI
jgi:hypothetical protein